MPPAELPAQSDAPTTLASTVPAAVAEARSAQGDLFVQVGHAIDQVGLTQTVMQTPALGWVLFAACVFVGLLAGRTVSAVVARFGKHAAERVKLFRAVILNSFVGPAGLFLFILGLGTGLTFLSLGPRLREFLIATFQLLNVITIGWLLYNLVDLVTLLINRWSRRRVGNLSVMLGPLVRKTLRVLLVTVLLLFAAENVFKQDVKALLAGLGIAGLAVSLAADTIRNFFGSIMIFADQPFAIGDRVKINEFEGKVADIGFRSTRLRAVDGYIVTIPNGNIAGVAVLNFSRRSTTRRTFDVTLPLDSTPQQMSTALRLLRETLADPDIAPGLDPTRPPTVSFDDPTQRRARVTYNFGSPDNKAYLAHAERLNLEIAERFHAAGIGLR